MLLLFFLLSFCFIRQALLVKTWSFLSFFSLIRFLCYLEREKCNENKINTDFWLKRGNGKSAKKINLFKNVPKGQKIAFLAHDMKRENNIKKKT